MYTRLTQEFEKSFLFGYGGLPEVYIQKIRGRTNQIMKEDVSRFCFFKVENGRISEITVSAPNKEKFEGIWEAICLAHKELDMKESYGENGPSALSEVGPCGPMAGGFFF